MIGWCRCSAEHLANPHHVYGSKAGEGIRSCVVCLRQAGLAKPITLQVRLQLERLALVTNKWPLIPSGNTLPLQWTLVYESLRPVMPCHHRISCLHSYGAKSTQLCYMVIDLTRMSVSPLTAVCPPLHQKKPGERTSLVMMSELCVLSYMVPVSLRVAWHNMFQSSHPHWLWFCQPNLDTCFQIVIPVNISMKQSTFAQSPWERHSFVSFSPSFGLKSRLDPLALIGNQSRRKTTLKTDWQFYLLKTACYINHNSSNYRSEAKVLVGCEAVTLYSTVESTVTKEDAEDDGEDFINNFWVPPRCHYNQ